jgi:uncharacterized protein YbjT (DUF2867 family)
MKTLVIGAHGHTGRMVTELLTHTNHAAVAMVRHPAQRSTFDALGVPTALADLEYPIDHAVAGCDAVIFAAGSGSQTGKDKTVLVDHLGAIRAAVAAQVHGARRFIMLSALNADVASTSAIAHYHRAKAHADQFLRESELDYTIICPGRLTFEPGAGRVTVSSDLHGQGTTARADLAQALVSCLDLPHTIGRSFSLLDGETPLADALAAV